MNLKQVNSMTVKKLVNGLNPIIIWFNCCISPHVKKWDIQLYFFTIQTLLKDWILYLAISQRLLGMFVAHLQWIQQDCIWAIQKVSHVNIIFWSIRITHKKLRFNTRGYWNVLVQNYFSKSGIQCPNIFGQELSALPLI